LKSIGKDTTHRRNEAHRSNVNDYAGIWQKEKPARGNRLQTKKGRSLYREAEVMLTHERTGRVYHISYPMSRAFFSFIEELGVQGAKE